MCTGSVSENNSVLNKLLNMSKMCDTNMFLLVEWSESPLVLLPLLVLFVQAVDDA
jgi:hypothetical protein